MSRIEQMLHQLHAETRQASQEEEVMDQSAAAVDWSETFVRVDSVETGSPAEQGVSRTKM